MRQVGWQWLGVLGVVGLVFGGCASSDVAVAPDGNEVAVGDDVPTDSTSAVATTATSAPEPASLRDPAAPISADTSYDPDAAPKLEWFAPFEPGTYRTGALGTPMSFTTTEGLNTQPNGDGVFVISDVTSRAPDDRELYFARVGAFSDPAAPNTSVEIQTFWPNDDFLGWLDNVHDGVIATEPVETTVNGLAAIQVDLRISDDMECGFLPGACVGLIENNGHDIKALNKGASYRVWIIEQGDEDPLLMLSGIARDEDAPWFERARAVMETIAFGEIAPNPAQWLESGTNQIDVLGGVEVNLPDNFAEITNGRPRVATRWNGRGFAQIPVTDSPATVYFADRPHDLEGNPFSSADDVVAQLTAAGAELTELDTTTTDGVDTRVFDLTTTDVGAIMLRFSPLDTAAPNLGWDAPAAGRIWLIEHPDRGLMMISAQAFENVDELLPKVNELGAAIVESLIFIDS